MLLNALFVVLIFDIQLNFDTQEDAVAFAKRNGWKYELKEATSKSNIPPGTYLYKHNFLDKRVSYKCCS